MSVTQCTPSSTRLAATASAIATAAPAARAARARRASATRERRRRPQRRGRRRVPAREEGPSAAAIGLSVGRARSTSSLIPRCRTNWPATTIARNGTTQRLRLRSVSAMASATATAIAVHGRAELRDDLQPVGRQRRRMVVRPAADARVERARRTSASGRRRPARRRRRRRPPACRGRARAARPVAVSGSMRARARRAQARARRASASRASVVARPTARAALDPRRGEGRQQAAGERDEDEDQERHVGGMSRGTPRSGAQNGRKSGTTLDLEHLYPPRLTPNRLRAARRQAPATAAAARRTVPCPARSTARRPRRALRRRARRSSPGPRLLRGAAPGLADRSPRSRSLLGPFVKHVVLTSRGLGARRRVGHRLARAAPQPDADRRLGRRLVRSAARRCCRSSSA